MSTDCGTDLFWVLEIKWEKQSPCLCAVLTFSWGRQILNKESEQVCLKSDPFSLETVSQKKKGEAEGTSKALNEGRVVRDKRGKKERYRLSKAIVRSLD